MRSSSRVEPPLLMRSCMKGEPCAFMEPSWLRPLGFCIPIVSVINEMTTGGFHLVGPSFSFSKNKNKNLSLV